MGPGRRNAACWISGMESIEPWLGCTFSSRTEAMCKQRPSDVELSKKADSRFEDHSHSTLSHGCYRFLMRASLGSVEELRPARVSSFFPLCSNL